MNWYAARTYARHEKAAHEQLAQRSIETFLPLYTCARRWRNRVNASVELPLFPGYVFVRADRSSFARVVQAPSVASLVVFGAEPAALPNCEIEALRDKVCLLAAEPHPYLQAGDQVRVVRGPLCGVEGLLVNKQGSYRLVLRLDMLMQAASVQVDAADVVVVKTAIQQRPL